MGKSSAQGARIKAPQVYECGVWGEGAHDFFILGLEMHVLTFGAFSGPFECLLLHCNTSRSRPPVRLPSLTFQADCGSIKGAGVPAEDGTEHYLPGGK